jgi:hypothetical protein
MDFSLSDTSTGRVSLESKVFASTEATGMEAIGSTLTIAILCDVPDEEDVHQVHVFSDSANTLCLTMDTSHHLGQHLSLSICKVMVPWL